MYNSGNADNLGFSIEETKKIANNLGEINQENVENENQFQNYIEEKMDKVWVTENGKKTAEELRQFLDTEFKSYVDYLNGRIDTLGSDVVETLNEIDQA